MDERGMDSTFSYRKSFFLFLMLITLFVSPFKGAVSQCEECAVAL